jgi:DeoR family transcriptional regulator of aga operon
MADAVANLVHDGDSVMIDGGSTTYYVAKSLSTKRGLTVITTSLYLLLPLMENAETKIFMTGGMIHRDFQDLVGGTAVDCLAKFSPTCAITGIDGYSIEHGLTTTESSTAQIKKKMLSVSRRMIVVADSSKYGKSCLFHVANLQEVHALVTDIKVPEELRNFLENSGVELICV